ncbi:MAG: hypothetical protein LC677_15490 [Halomonas sp.]|nr:hypothetical protein [Halomonas sp.]
MTKKPQGNGSSPSGQNESLQALLVELEQFGQENDAAITDRLRQMLNMLRQLSNLSSSLN